MAIESISTYYENLRAVLGDAGSNGVYQWKDAQLAAAVRTTVQTNLGPAGVAVKSDDPASLDPAPATPDARGYLVYQTALSLVGGRQNVSFQTRPMKVMHRPEERKMSIDHFLRMIRKIEEEGDPHGTGVAALFGVWTDWENHVCRLTEPTRTA